MTEPPNRGLQRTAALASLRASAAEADSFGVRVIVATMCVLMGVPSLTSARGWKRGAESVIRFYSIQVERRVSPFVSVKGTDWKFQVESLDPRQVETVRLIILTALRDNRKAEEQARSKGQIPAGVPGCVSNDFRVTFRPGARSEIAWLHLGSGWLEGGTGLGNIVFSEKQRRRLEEILGRVDPC